MDATLSSKNGVYTLTLQRRLGHSTGAVWQAITDRSFLTQWFPAEIAGEWQVDEPLEFTFLHGEGDGMPDEALRGRVLAVEPEHLLAFRWGGHSLSSELAAESDGCRLTFSDRFEDPSDAARGAAGWEMCLDNLGRVLDGDDAAGFDVELWNAKFARYRDRFEPGAGPQQGMPDDYPTESA